MTLSKLEIATVVIAVEFACALLWGFGWLQ